MLTILLDRDAFIFVPVSIQTTNTGYAHVSAVEHVGGSQEQFALLRLIICSK